MQINLEQFIDNVFRFSLSLTRDRHLAEDLTQECYLKAQRNICQLRDPEATKAWLFQILINLWKDGRKRKMIPMTHSEQVDFPDNRGQCPEQLAVQREATDSVLEVMQTLPERQRNVLFLSVVEQLTNNEVAQLMSLSESNVKANLSIAKKAMRTKIIRRQQAEQSETQ